MSDGNSCATCRYVSKSTRPKIMDATGFDDQLMFEDVDETVYACRAEAGLWAGKEVGTEPVSACPVWEAPTKEDEHKERADAMLAKFEARLAARSAKGGRDGTE